MPATVPAHPAAPLPLDAAAQPYGLRLRVDRHKPPPSL